MIIMAEQRFQFGSLGLILSLVSGAGLWLIYVDYYLALAMTMLSLPGIACGIIGRFRGEMWPGFWAILVGCIVALFLPTLWLPMLRPLGNQ